MTNTSPKEWRCFHCDECFTDPSEALLHFGETSDERALCQFTAAEIQTMMRELIAYQTDERESELRIELEKYKEEDSDLHREIRRLRSEMSTRERRAEEAGYAKGLADARKYPETLGLQHVPDSGRTECEHGIEDGGYCEPCNLEYKRAATEHEKFEKETVPGRGD